MTEASKTIRNWLFSGALALLTSCCSALATPARVQGNSARTGSGTSISVTPASATTTGNLVIGCVVQGSGANPTGVSDGTNNYTLVNGASFAGFQGTLFYKINATGTSAPIVASFSSGTGAYMMMDEFSGVSTSAAVDGSAAGTANNTSGTNSFSSGSFTPAQNGDLIYGCLSSLSGTNTFTPGTSPNFTAANASSANNAFTEYLVQATAAAIASAFSTSTTDYGWIEGAGFQAASGGGSSHPHSMIGSGL